MTDFEHIVPLWRELEDAQRDYVLATVVEVQGSSYRRPGARMLLAPDGRRAGAISGGCLEAEVAKKAWWLTERGPVVERYSTLDDDGDMPYGSGCGGVVFLLLERRSTALPMLEALYAAWTARVSLAIATVIEGPHIGYRVFAGPVTPPGSPHFAAPQLDPWQVDLQQLACSALEERTQRKEHVPIDGLSARVWVDYRSARPGLWIFGAGDDTKPLHKLARELGWYVAVADGRTHLATSARFPEAHSVFPLEIAGLPTSPPAQLDLRSGDAAVVATHSFEQDTRILALLVGSPPLRRPAYIGVLGPQRRTREALADAARLLDLVPAAKLVEQWLDEINAPTGLDLGADTPATIALSILAEIQKSLAAASALPLRQVRVGVPHAAAR